MSDRIEISWQVEDGYVGKSRPQRTLIEVEDLEFCETEDEVEQLIYDAIGDDFVQTISWAISDGLEEAKIAWAELMKERREEEE